MKIKLLFLLLIASPLVAFGQKYKITAGDYSALSGATEFNVEVDYSQVTYYNEKMSEAKYIERRMKDKDGDDVNAIKKDWDKMKEERIPDKITTIANKYCKNGQNYAVDNGAAKITMIVRPQWIYPGWFGGVMKSPSKINVNYDFVDAANPSKVLLSISCTKAVGDIYPVGIPNTNMRIAEAFAHSTKGLVRLLNKKIK